MRALKRITQSITVGIESLIDQVENQEAVATATIRDVERGLASIRAHRKRCERRMQELSAARDAASQAAERWRARTLRFAADRERALTCLERAQDRERARGRFDKQLDEHRSVLAQVTADEQAVEARLHALRRRCTELSSRQAREAVASASYEDAEAVFDRWEARLGTSASSDDLPTVDAFEEQLSREEQRAELEAELERMIAAQTPGGER